MEVMHELLLLRSKCMYMNHHQCRCSWGPSDMGHVRVHAVWTAEADEFDGSRAGRHFAVPIGHGAGKPYPLGPTLVHTTRPSSPQDVRCTMNFAVSR
jgi:hypothetical protein